MSKQEVLRVEIHLTGGESVRYNGYEDSLNQAIDLLEEKARELRLSKTNAGRLERYFLGIGFSQGSASKYARDLDKLGWTDQPLTPPEPESKCHDTSAHFPPGTGLHLTKGELEAVRVVTDAARVTVKNGPLVPRAAIATENAIEILGRFEKP